MVILPKAIREAAGFEEGDLAILEVGDGIHLKPEKKLDVEKLNEALEKHRRELVELGITGPQPGELAEIYGEMEFEDEDPPRY